MPADQEEKESPPSTGGLDALVGATLAGDREAYRQIITLSEAKVRVVLAAILPDSSVVEDLAQEVYVTAFYKLVDYRPGSDFLASLTTIARNLALNERRRWHRRERFKRSSRHKWRRASRPRSILRPSAWTGLAVRPGQSLRISTLRTFPASSSRTRFRSRIQLAQARFSGQIGGRFWRKTGCSIQSQYTKIGSPDFFAVSCWLSSPRGGIGRRARFRF